LQTLLRSPEEREGGKGGRAAETLDRW
jgi:hypothetical protein